MSKKQLLVWAAVTAAVVIVVLAVLTMFDVNQADGRQGKKFQFRDSSAVSLDSKQRPAKAQQIVPADTVQPILALATHAYVYEMVNGSWFKVKDVDCRIEIAFGQGKMAIASKNPQFFKVDHVISDSTDAAKLRTTKLACYDADTTRCIVVMVTDASNEAYVKIVYTNVQLVYQVMFAEK